MYVYLQSPATSGTQVPEQLTFGPTAFIYLYHQEYRYRLLFFYTVFLFLPLLLLSTYGFPQQRKKIKN
jgi:hypothetical protein